MAANETAFELFKRAIGGKITEITGLNDVFYERSKDAGYPASATRPLSGCPVPC